MSLPALVVYEAVGYATTEETFNDVQDVGLWPSHLYIEKVAKITLYTGNTIINGIEITYDMTNDSPKTVVHGKKEGNPHSHSLAADEFFVGFFGAMDENPDAPVLRRVGFVVYNKDTGGISTFGL
ncbi:hypothetical protein C0992_003167 [Termitomyces sp. T32_za158]|nr:hypothetical protein C0992_003167 [Termitomyces sp. T32_za158]